MDYSLIIKLTNNCNLNCSYCYHRRDLNRDLRLSLDYEQLELMIKQLLAHNEHHAEFIWHGGEPLLMGLDTFQFIIDKQKEHNKKGLQIRNSVQTNGTLLNEEYIDFFNQHRFSVGISIDGPFDMHASERGTFPAEYEVILNSLEKLGQDQTSRYGVLCVVGKQHIGQAHRIFEMIDTHKIGNIAFLPCMVHKNGVVDETATILPEEYAQFLIDLFEIWVNGNSRGLSVRNFDDCIRFYRGKPTKTCISCNICDEYLTVTPDGGIYLCDNFASSPQHKVGTLQDGFDNLDVTGPMQWIKQAMTQCPEECHSCKYYTACYGGCKYYRWIADPAMQEKQYYCHALKRFYDHVGAYMPKKE